MPDTSCSAYKLHANHARNQTYMPTLERSKKMARKSSSLLIVGFLFVMICLQFFPICLAARNLESFPQPPGGNGDQDNDGGSKVDVDGSQRKHDGSANGDHVPTTGVVQTPPTSFHKSYQLVQRNGTQTVRDNRNGVTTRTWSENQRDMDWNGRRSTTRDSSVNVTNNGNGGGQVVYSPPIIAYQPPKGPENPQFHFPPVPPSTFP